MWHRQRCDHVAASARVDGASSTGESRGWRRSTTLRGWTAGASHRDHRAAAMTRDLAIGVTRAALGQSAPGSATAENSAPDHGAERASTLLGAARDLGFGGTAGRSRTACSPAAQAKHRRHQLDRQRQSGHENRGHPLQPQREPVFAELVGVRQAHRRRQRVGGAIRHNTTSVVRRTEPGSHRGCAPAWRPVRTRGRRGRGARRTGPRRPWSCSAQCPAGEAVECGHGWSDSAR